MTPASESTIQNFLSLLRPGGSVALTSIDPEKRRRPVTKTRTFVEGQAAGADQIIAFMKNKMVTENSERAAEWLADKVFGLSKPNDSADTLPRVNIILNHALAPAEYARVIQVQQGALTHDFG